MDRTPTPLRRIRRQPSRLGFLPVTCLTAVVLALGSTVAGAQEVGAPDPDSLVARLHTLFEAPIESDETGDGEIDPGADGLPDVSEATYRARIEALRERLAALDAIEPDALPREERINYDVFRRMTRDRIGELEHRAYLMPFTTFVPFYSTFPDMASGMRLETVRDYERYLARIRDWRRQVGQYIDLMRIGLEAGVTLPRNIVEGVPAELTPHIVADPTRSRLWQAMERMPESIPDSAAERLRTEVRAAIEESAVPGYGDFLEFLEMEYIPRTRTSYGISEIPGGGDFYRHRVRMYTTLDITPEEVHRRGQAEVARIRGEMQEIIDSVGFDGSFAEFLAFLRTDDRFYADTPEELMKENAYVLKRMDGMLPQLFGKLPRTPYGIRPIPDFAAPRMTTAYYSSAPSDGSRGGIYYINTYDLNSRPLYEVTSLSFHEAVPGHHLQRAIQIEIEDVPDFRRSAGFTAYVEGWALYSERLGLEVGDFYDDPYTNFGRLTYEMWRALRLVVDTGIHWYGWDRQRAIDYMAENSALSLLNITSEVDRYISWPGQALGYKMGEIVIRDLRAEAEERLGSDFDIRGFHDTILWTGPVPMSVLQDTVRRWIEEEASSGASAPSIHL